MTERRPYRHPHGQAQGQAAHGGDATLSDEHRGGEPPPQDERRGDEETTPQEERRVEDDGGPDGKGAPHE